MVSLEDLFPRKLFWRVSYDDYGLLQISQGLSTTLLRLVDDLKSGFDSTMDRDLENLRNKEQMANELITKIQSDVNYINGLELFNKKNNFRNCGMKTTSCLLRSVQRNVSKSSYNQTEAATRWTKIAQRFDIANLSADMALASSQKAINTLTSDLSARSKGLLARSNTIHVETTSMQDFVTGELLTGFCNLLCGLSAHTRRHCWNLSLRLFKYNVRWQGISLR